MRLQIVQDALKKKNIKYEYTEIDGCGSLDFLFRGLKFHVWEYEDRVWGAETNIYEAGRSQDIEGNYEEVIAREFSERVAKLVAQESEDKSKTWIERKNRTVCHIKEADPDVQKIALADKLSNMRDINRDYPVYGEELWNRFRMKDKSMIGWYYKGVRDALRDVFAGEPAYEEYCRLVEANFGK